MRAVILAGGRGTRLFPATAVVSKQLLPVYDTPMIYYPVSLLMRAGVRDFLVISTPESLPAFRTLLGDGSRFGTAISYAEQAEPRGIAEALIIAEEFAAGEPITLALGDNLFLGQETPRLLRNAFRRPRGASVFATAVDDPQSFGIVEFDAAGQALSIEEKPRAPRSNFALTGLYVYDGQAAQVARAIQPSGRGELEITDVNRHYLEQGLLNVELVPEEDVWFDTGTPASLLEASTLVQSIENKSGGKVAGLEAIAYEAGWISAEEVRDAAKAWSNSLYGRSLLARLALREKSEAPATNSTAVRAAS